MDPSPAPVGLVSPNYFGATSLLFGSACTPSGLRTHLWTSFELDGCAGNVAQSPLGNGATSRNGLRLALQARYSSQPLNAGSLAPMSASISAQYAAQVAAGKIERDNAQQAIVNRLVRLENELAARRLARKPSSLGWLFAGHCVLLFVPAMPANLTESESRSPPQPGSALSPKLRS